MKYFVWCKIVQSSTITHTINFLSRTIYLQKSAQFSFFPAPCQKACNDNDGDNDNKNLAHPERNPNTESDVLRIAEKWTETFLAIFSNFI